MNCPKCGVDVIDTQKICPQCGAFLPASGYFYQDEKRFHITPKMKKGAWIVGGLILLLLIINAVRVSPPDQVAKEYIELLSERNVPASKKLVTQSFEDDLQERMHYISDISGELFLFTPAGTATTFTSSVAGYDNPDQPASAKVSVTINNTQYGIKVVNLDLVKQGRRWYINRLYM